MKRLIGMLVLLVLSAPRASAQWSTTYEQFYLQSKHNWEFRERYQAADRLFNAFDYGHAILYETLWRHPSAPPDRLERDEYQRLTREILVRPPRVPLEEGAIEISYARLAPEAKAMFEWAHILHRQIYDVWADESIPLAQKDRYVAELLAYYRSRPDLAFSSRPKSMALMQEQPYSLAFRQRYPKFNGLIWAYHWLQVGLYEPLVVGRTVEERQALVRATVARFWQMLEDPVATMPHQMPMTAAVAPTFAARYPEAAIIFDNLHSMHDVISDILANPSVPRKRKREAIMLAARRYRDDTSYVMPVEAWRTMSVEMGVANMGGPAVGFTPALPQKTVTYGAVMLHDEETGRMTGMKVGEMLGMETHTMPGMAHEAGPAASHQDDSTHAHAAEAAPGHHAVDAGAALPSAVPDTALRQHVRALHDRLMADPMTRRRIMADSAMWALMEEIVRALDTSPVEPRRPPPAADPHAGHRPPRER